MRKLFYLLIPVFTLFIACEADEIFDINQEIIALDAKVEEQGDELRAADAANFAQLQQIIDNVVEAQAKINTQLQEAIAAEAAARESGDEAVAAEARRERNELAVELTAKITDLANTTAANDAKLLDLINAEAEARANGDLKLAEEIADQVNILKTKDNILQNQILSNARFMSGVASDLASEVAERKVVTDSLQTQITSNTLEINANRVLIDGNKVAIDAIDTEVGELSETLDTVSNTLDGVNDIVDQLVIDVDAAEEQLSNYIMFDENIVDITVGYTLNFQVVEGSSVTIGFYTREGGDIGLKYINFDWDDIPEDEAPLLINGVNSTLINIDNHNFELKIAENELTQAENGIDIVITTTSLNDLLDKVDDLTSSVTELEDAVESLQVSLTLAEQAIEDNSNDIETLVSTIADLELTVDSLTTSLTALESQLENAEGDIDSLQENITALQISLEEADSKILELEEKISELDNQVIREYTINIIIGDISVGTYTATSTILEHGVINIEDITVDLPAGYETVNSSGDKNASGSTFGIEYNVSAYDSKFIITELRNIQEGIDDVESTIDMSAAVREIPSYVVTLNITYGEYSKTLSSTVVYNTEDELTWPLFDLEGGYEFTSNSNKKNGVGFTYGYSVSNDKFYVNLSDVLDAPLNINYDLDPYVSNDCAYGSLDTYVSVTNDHVVIIEDGVALTTYNITWNNVDVNEDVPDTNVVNVTKLVINNTTISGDQIDEYVLNSDGKLRNIRIVPGAFSKYVDADGDLVIALGSNTNGPIPLEITLDDTNCDSETGGTASISNIRDEATHTSGENSGEKPKKPIGLVII